MQVKQKNVIECLELKKEERRVRFVTIVMLEHQDVVDIAIDVVDMKLGVLVVKHGLEHAVKIMEHVCVVNF